jgi:hypothetical protein
MQMGYKFEIHMHPTDNHAILTAKYCPRGCGNYSSQKASDERPNRNHNQPHNRAQATVGVDRRRIRRFGAASAGTGTRRRT